MVPGEVIVCRDAMHAPSRRWSSHFMTPNDALSGHQPIVVAGSQAPAWESKVGKLQLPGIHPDVGIWKPINQEPIWQTKGPWPDVKQELHALGSQAGAWEPGNGAAGLDGARDCAPPLCVRSMEG